MQIEEGKFYSDRDGVQIGPIERRDDDDIFPFQGLTSRGDMRSFTGSGTYWHDGDFSNFDLVTEWTGETETKAQPEIQPERVKILHDGALLTNGSRDAEYGPPSLNMACAGELKSVFRKHLRREISEAELEALDMAITKLGRLATGTPKRDTYVDAATYIAIAGEIALSK
jgi:hypothetical protein